MKTSPPHGHQETTRPQRTRSVALACLLVGALFTGALFADAEATAREVALLLEHVRASDCAFIRNGKKHTAADAADHLAQKYRRGRRYVTTTETFLDRLASKSSMSGKPYLVVCDTREEPAGAWLHRVLKSMREKAATN